MRLTVSSIFFFFNDTATTEIYTLSLHDALPISGTDRDRRQRESVSRLTESRSGIAVGRRSEEHTSELQSQSNLVCRLLLEKKKISRQIDIVCSLRDRTLVMQAAWLSATHRATGA